MHILLGLLMEPAPLERTLCFSGGFNGTFFHLTQALMSSKYCVFIDCAFLFGPH